MLTVITSITGGRDNLREDFNKTNDIYIAYLDEEVSSDMWDVRKSYDRFKNLKMNAKIHKVLAHQFIDTKYSIWLDGNISLKVEPKALLEWVKDKDIAVWKHFGRDCCYEEAKTVIGCGLDDKWIVNMQMDKYRSEGYLENAGLGECNVIVRKHTKEINALCEKWWAEICRHSTRDQLSFNYVFRDKVNLIEGNPRNHKDFNYNNHNV